MTDQTFSMIIERHVLETGMPYIDAVIDICEKNDIELSLMKNSLNKNLKEKIELEAKKLKLMSNNDISTPLF